MLSGWRRWRALAAILAIAAGFFVWRTASRSRSAAALGPRAKEALDASASETATRLEVSGSERAIRPEDARAPEIEADPRASELQLGAIAGRVFDHQTQPLSGIEVRVEEAGADWFTAAGRGANADRNGYYSIEGLHAGAWWLQIQGLEGFGCTRIGQVEIQAGETTHYDIVLAGTHRLSGLFEFSQEWNEIQGAVIRLELLLHEGASVRLIGTAEAVTERERKERARSGQFEFMGLLPGVYELRAYPFTDDQYFPRTIELQSDLRLIPAVFGQDLQFHDVPDHPGAAPFDSRADER